MSVLFFGMFAGWCLYAAELETRMHHFEYAPPHLVERQIRALVPEAPRVSMNPRANQVIVIADAETQERVAAMLKVLGRPPRKLKFRVQHNREVLTFTVADGVPLTLPVSQTPPHNLIMQARGRLAPETRNLPVVGSALQAHVILLREEPAVLRVRVVPAVIFGALQPYQIVSYDDLAMDVMLDTEEYLELQKVLSHHDFYRQFLLTQPDPSAAPRPVSLLVSFEGLEFPQPGPEDEN
ncbi:hypothetical protein P0Y35_00310 [Kiritimatiellaeota bacterium B1221]|nr:hypothetical protein [Kiritimatiellaeota bacterium B1221]